LGFTYGLTLALALICLLASSPALAINECGAPPANGGTINCSASSFSGDGIYYDLGNGDWTINLQSDLTVDAVGTHRHALHVDHTGTGSLTINMLGASLTAGSITQNTRAIFVEAGSNTGSLTVNMSSGIINTEGTNSQGIRVHKAGGGGDINIVVSKDEDLTLIDTLGYEFSLLNNECHGIYATHAGSGDINIGVSSAFIDASGSLSHSIYAKHSGSGNITLDVDDNAYIAALDETSFAVHAEHTGTGSMNIGVSGSTLKSVGDALKISSTTDSTPTLTIGPATTLTAGLNYKSIVLGLGNDTLTVTGGSTAAEITGDMDFGDGVDTMIFNAANANDRHLTSADALIAFTGLENIRKTGTGDVYLNNILSTGSVMTLEQGGLHLDGYLNLGGTGEITIRNGSELIFVADDNNHGRIFASQVKFSASNWQRLFVASGSLAALDGEDVLVNGNARFLDNSGETIEPELYNENGTDTGLIITEDGIVGGDPPDDGGDPPDDGGDPPDDGGDPPDDGGDPPSGQGHRIDHSDGGDPPDDVDDSTGGSGGCSIGGGDNGNGSIAAAGLFLFLFGLIMFLETGRKMRKELKRSTVS